MGRNTQGVKLIELGKRGDTIASVCKVDSAPEENIDEELEEQHEHNQAVRAQNEVIREAAALEEDNTEENGGEPVEE